MTQDYAALEQRLRKQVSTFDVDGYGESRAPQEVPDVMTEAAGAIAALTRQLEEAREQARKWELFAQQRVLDERRSQAALSSLKREVLEAIEPFSREYARITAEADGFAIWSPQHDGSASVVLNLDRGGFTARVTAGELHRLADLASRLSRGTEP